MTDIGFMSCLEWEQFSNFEKFAFKSSQTLLEYDIVLWDIGFLHFGYYLSSDHRVQEIERLFQDRKRRLYEIELLLNNGKSLAILLAKSLIVNFNDRYGNFDATLNPEIKQIINLEFNRSDGIDTYSFLPPSIETLIREYSIVASGRKMVCSEDNIFSGVCNKLIGKACYYSYFKRPIGYPILFIESSQNPVACWLRYSNGNVFLLPGTEYDDSSDYPIFVEVVEELVEIAEGINLSELDVPIFSSDVDTLEIWSEDMTFVDSARLGELKLLETDNFDLAKLIRLCEELNKCFSSKCYYATAMLSRAILDHVPPIFGYKSFLEVANNYSGTGISFKAEMLRLENSSRKIADSYLHLQVRKKESLPNKTQVDFRSDLDVLLGEIVRILK